jgi:hypothetical protein
MDIGNLYLESCMQRFNEYKALGDRAFEQVQEEQMSVQPNPASNSLAIIIQHLHGNMVSRWTAFLTEDGEKPWSKRVEEFEPQGYSKEQLLDLWNKGWHVFLTALASLTNEDLSKTVTIRNQPLTVLDAINRQMAHYSYHVGQIVYVARWLKDAEWQSLSIPK